MQRLQTIRIGKRIFQVPKLSKRLAQIIHSTFNPSKMSELKADIYTVGYKSSFSEKTQNSLWVTNKHLIVHLFPHFYSLPDQS